MIDSVCDYKDFRYKSQGLIRRLSRCLSGHEIGLTVKPYMFTMKSSVE